MRWWWVRHAPTHARAAVGWTDVAPDLSDAARLDALAGGLPQGPVLSSDLARARLTADRIAGDRPQLKPDRALRELHFGDWEGLDFDTIAARWPAQSRAFFAEPGPSPAPGGEAFNALRRRVRAAVERRQAEEGDMIVVAHAGSIQAALSVAAGLDAAQALRFVIPPLSVTRLDWLADAQAWRVDRVAAPTKGH